jgi:hypothetical protein
MCRRTDGKAQAAEPQANAAGAVTGFARHETSACFGLKKEPDDPSAEPPDSTGLGIDR